MARHARRLSIDPTEIQVLHLWNRCVRRSYLCGRDPLTGQDYEYRRQCFRDRLEHLASIFVVDCLTFWAEEILSQERQSTDRCY